jgi:hypothetical protein
MLLQQASRVKTTVNAKAFAKITRLDVTLTVSQIDSHPTLSKKKRKKIHIPQTKRNPPLSLSLSFAFSLRQLKREKVVIFFVSCSAFSPLKRTRKER